MLKCQIGTVIMRGKMKTNEKNRIGENIRNLRREREVKQITLALELQIGRQSVSAYERGVTLPDIYLLIRIADYFDVTLDELTGRER
ncbi:helix-turn-helix transcriptional regulator [Mediterraneibacter catenae]|uniref:Helix-turn-helix transcriptional regulator n=2 Tax=Lachnospiraceae TaxID=186803 RepID=A0A5M9HZ87_9FIRM|nr:helix-turn-helix transcriptional regulator [Mediterraneibacter catenae]MCF2569577.1 helix-turn-helix transcriptional regulator [Mediterraneibacter glycyrrhizinilyticus]OUO26190.1 hypothetical protein B5F86_11370 [Lachnoclostridium sp. An298]HJA19720.1 helix-turn-helix domain-containing protein [Candidatus Mediterraneibacter ornithocaccae]